MGRNPEALPYRPNIGIARPSPGLPPQLEPGNSFAVRGLRASISPLQIEAASRASYGEFKRFTGLSDTPLPEVPLMGERTIDRRQLNTAGHEFNHIAVGLALGGRILGTSLDRKKENGRLILGETMINAPLMFFPAITAAGMVSPFTGEPAYGYGGDMRQLKAFDVQFNSGKSSLEPAFKKAKAILDKIPPLVREIAAEIIVYSKNLIGEKAIEALIKRAYLEAAYFANQEGIMDGYRQLINGELADINEQKLTDSEMGEIKIVYRPQRVVVTFKGNRGTEVKLRYCPRCHGIGTHSPHCPLLGLPKNGIIFSAPVVVPIRDKILHNN